ncbi:MAG: hypothetical protein IBX63_12075 [Coriobacteriia bacterium]|nr:hypothetical protein [Coriobacteriia bacterium]
MPIGAQSGLEVAFQEVIYYAGPIVQLGYWLVMIVAALWAVTLFKRWVDFQTCANGTAEEAGRTGAAAAPAAPAAPEKPVSIEEFVE